MAEKTPRQQAQNTRGKKIRRRAWQKLREAHPSECIFKIAELDGRELARKYSEEFKEAKARSKIELEEELGPVLPEKSNPASSFYQRFRELEERVKVLEEWKSQNDLEGLDEL
jgi:hypothetical protein